MAKSAAEIVAEARDPKQRYVDMQIRWMPQNERGRVLAKASPLIVAGGRWDRQSKKWSGSAAETLTLEFHPGQLPGAKWSVEWLLAKARGELVHDSQGRALYSCALHGGRRSGKTDLACKFAVTYAVMRPESRVWLVSESLGKTQELSDAVREWLPSTWYSWLGAPRFEMTLPNGSRIWFRSAHDPEDLKRGRADFVLLNEAQNMNERTFAIVRPATADNSGLTLLAMNPWINPIGAWTERFYEEARAGQRQAIEFELDYTLNPHVDHGSLEALKNELDERSYRQEVLGEYLPREDVVFHAWKSSGAGANVRSMPTEGECTREFLRKHLHRNLDRCAGLDFQRNPYPCAVSLRFFGDVDDPEIYFDEFHVVEKGDEYDLSAALIEAGFERDRTALIGDASGETQGIDRKKRVPSFEILTDLGWKHIFQPDANTRKNPNIVERVKCANSLFCNANGRRRVFSRPENVELNRAIKLWETRNGVPYRRSDYAHLCDAATYPLWRFFPRKEAPKPPPKPNTMHAVNLGGRGPRIL